MYIYTHACVLTSLSISTPRFVSVIVWELIVKSFFSVEINLTFPRAMPDA